MIRRTEEPEKTPADEFSWNVHQFPEHDKETPEEEKPGEPTKKSVEFDWQTDKSEFRGKPGKDEVAFAPYLKEKEEFRGFKSDETIRLEREAAERAGAAARAAEEEADAQQRKAAEDIEAEERAAAEKRAAAEAEAEKERRRAEEEEIQRRLEIEAKAKIEAERRAAEAAEKEAADRAAAEKEAAEAAKAEAAKKAEETAKAEAVKAAAEKEAAEKEAGDAAEAAADEPEDIIRGKELEEALFSDMRASEKADGNIDKFYTFNKKNEEFQKLLDREYEKFSNGRTVIDDKEFEQSVVSVSDGEGAAAAAGQEDGADKPEHVKEMERARAVFFADDMDAELGLDKKEPDEKVREEFAGIESAGIAAAAGLELFPNKSISETISEASTDTSFAAMQPDQVITDDDEPEFDEDEESEEAETAEPDEGEEPEEIEEPELDEEEEPEETEEPEPDEEEEPEETGEPEPDEEEGPEETEEPGPAEDEAAEEAESGEPETETKEEPQPAEAEPQEAGETEGPAKTEEPADETAEEPEAEKTKVDNEEYDDDDEEDHRGGRAGKIVVGILIVVILAELAFLGIRFLAPDSSIAVKMDSMADKIVMMIRGDDTSSTQTQTVTAMIERI
jgi:hypothetical protein